ncbi:MAG: TolC family protein [Verrucomicrobiota bacterium]
MPRIDKFPLLFLVLCSSALAQTPSTKPAQPIPIEDAPAALMTLEHAYDIAAASDQTLRIAFLEVSKAELLPWSALTRITPRFTGAMNYARSSTSFANSTTQSRNGETTQGNLNLQQPLLDLSVFPARRKGRLAVESSRLARQFTIRETLFGVASAYFDVLKGERIVAVNKQSLALAQEQQSLAQKRADVGEVTRSDVLRAQVSVETARRVLITAENTLELQRNTLRNILNLRYDAPLRLAEPLPFRRDIPTFESLLAQAYDRREDLRERDLAIQQAEQARLEIRSQYAPTVVAEAGPVVSKTSGFVGAAGRSSTWSADVSVQIPFFTGGQRELDLVNARLVIDQSALDKERLSKTIEGQVKGAWLDVQTKESSLRALKTQVQAAEQGYTDLQNQYSAGTAKSVDVLSALQDLSTARLALTSLTLDYEVALRALEQASGVFQDLRVREIMEKKR